MSEPNINTATTEKDTESRKLLFMKVRKCFWIAIAILAILLLLSIIILTARIIDYAASAEREVSLNSDIHKDKLDIFDIKYENESGEITVHGIDYDKVVAPGTDVEYTIRVRNTDRIAIDYELLPAIEFLSEHKLPILVRVLDHNDDYIVGSAKEWADITELNGAVHRHTLMSGECVEYTFQWMWPYEQGDDAYDTFLGSVSEDVGLKVTFTVNAAANLDIGANGGLIPSGWAKNIAIFIAALIILIAIILLIISILTRNIQTTPEPTVVEVIKTVEVPVAAPVVVPAPMPEPKREGFNGKMAYVNIDVINENFDAGEVVTLSALKKKGLLPANTKQMKILARNGFKLDKALIVETQGISTEARRIIVEAGGMVFITKG